MSKTDYGIRTVDMLIACSTIVMSAIDNKLTLQEERSTWQDPFFEDYQTKIETTIQTYLGMNGSRDMKLATQQVLNIAEISLKFLTRFKKQVEQDFKDNPERRDFILGELGYGLDYVLANKNHDQEALVNLLFTYKGNLTPDLKTEIVAKGVSENLMNNIIAQAEILKSSNVVQEFHKGTRKIFTAEATDAFNSLYNQAISICVISRDLFKGDKERQDLFSFSKVSKNMNHRQIPTETVQ